MAKKQLRTLINEIARHPLLPKCSGYVQYNVLLLREGHIKPEKKHSDWIHAVHELLHSHKVI